MRLTHKVQRHRLPLARRRRREREAVMGMKGTSQMIQTSCGVSAGSPMVTGRGKVGLLVMGYKVTR